MSVRTAINVFTSIAEGGKYSKELFQNSIATLKENALNGLENEDIEVLMNVLLKNKLKTVSQFLALLSCLIPKKTISSDVVDEAVVWLLSVYHDIKTSSKIIGMLNWITGLMEFELVDKGIIDGYYNLFYGLLCYEKYQHLGCKLLYMLTRPGDVNRCRIKLMIHYHSKNGKAKHTAALLGLCKSYKPEWVPGAFSMQNIHIAFKNIPPEMKVGFENAQQRLLEQSHQQSQQNNRLIWFSAPADKKGRKGIPLIPEAMYCHLGSEAYREKRRKVIDFLDKEALACHQLTTEMPTCILSLILNEGGIHLLTTSNSDVHSRFSVVLYHVLSAAFCLHGNLPNTSYLERERLLEQLVLLEDYMQQGIPVVSRFLAEYIGSWNGQDHRSFIYRLLERVTFKSFMEFDYCILDSMRTLFLTGNVPEKCTIINTLRNLICNMFVASGLLGRNESQARQHFFLGEEWSWETDTQTVLPELIQVVSDFGSQGIIISNSHPLILHATISFFETLVDLEEKRGQLMTVLPPAVMYACLFSSNLSMLSRASGLLLRYQKLRNTAGLSAESIRIDTLLNEYSCDLYNLLINKKAFSKSEQGFIFSGAKELERRVSLGDSAFSLERDLTILGLSFQMLEMNYITKIPIDLNEELSIALMFNFDNLNELIEVLRKKYAQYHRR